MKRIIKMAALLGIIGMLGGCSQQAAAVTTSKVSLAQQESRLSKSSSSLKEKLAQKKYQATSLKKAYNSASLAEVNSSSTEKIKASSSATTRTTSSASSSAITAETSSAEKVTTGQGAIVGNRNSHIYHVPGQAGYQMNSTNAVYFSTEAQAQAAGYRKALR